MELLLGPLPQQPAVSLERSADAARRFVEPLPERGQPYSTLLPLLFEQAIPNEEQRPLALSAYKVKYSRLWRQQSPMFAVQVARDLREMIRLREAG